jgi:hypothetical protein
MVSRYSDAPPDTDAASNGSNGLGASAEAYMWEAAIPLMQSGVVMRQVFVVIALSVVLLTAFMLALTALDGDLTGAVLWQIGSVMLLILAGMLLLAWLAMLVIYRNRYEYRFRLDEHGIEARVAGATRKTNRLVNTLLMLSGRPSAASAGMLAGSRQTQYVRWSGVDDLVPDARRHAIVLRRNKIAVMLVQCHAGNYDAVLRRARAALSQAGRPSQTA